MSMEPVAGSIPVPDGRRKRKLRNYLLDAKLQLRLASYLIGVGVALSLGLGWLLWRAYRETSRVIALSDPEQADSLGLALANEDRVRIIVIGVALAGVLICLLGSALVVSHRIAGPAFAITRTCKQVADGNLTRPRPLRPRDLLLELGNEVARMVDALRSRETSEREIALAAASALRDPAAGAEARSQAADALEKIAREKGERIR